ncbi:FGGY-family carbohydrate kinase [Acidipropionibacterium virtanenii]|uniref:Ribulokinase n=1 Tax=Acidipropionibacterium virtanenii TaxID=2057246 RepID=A0A344UR49_9ACTN|nr:FGGY family carbohydrate kinase [Acidipropionibacterium virtanenii]AXE37747.1 Ribulokinase [Acidipropionibacterium virtanenii]
MIDDGPYLLGIDYGTESCRVAIFDLQGHPLAFAATPYQTRFPHPAWAEQDPDEWWLALQASAHRAIAAAGISPAAIAGISYDATTFTLVSMDAKGESIRPAIMWMDNRATAQAARAEQSDSAARLVNNGGKGAAPAEAFPFKAAWLRENEPDNYVRAAHLVDAADWLTYKLTGEWTTNIHSNSLRGYYDRARGGWPADFFAAVGADDLLDKVPERVLNVGDQVGTLASIPAQLLGLRPGIPVAQGLCDAGAGQIGLGVVAPGDMALITGSSHVLYGQMTSEIHGEGFWGSYTDAVVPGQYTVEGSGVSTGSVLKWFKDNFASDIASAAEKVGLNPYDVLNTQSADIPIGSDGLIVNEYFQGNRTPYTDSKARGIMWGLSLAHTPAHVYHAIQEAIAFGTANSLIAMTDAGFGPTKMVACGGATKSRAWMQMHSDVTGVPIALTEVGDAVVLGTCMVAAVGAGLYTDLGEAAANMVHQIDILEPDADRHQEYGFYLDRYRRSFPLMQRLIHEVVDHEAAKH